MPDSSMGTALTMSHNRIITENQLDEWVRGNARIAQGVIVELVWRLVSASSPRPNERRFPLGDSIEQPGPDGVLIRTSISPLSSRRDDHSGKLAREYKPVPKRPRITGI
jgi:hypothetical protein